jgi:signal transduction histidine kinase
MVLKTALIVSVVLQFGAFAMVVSLIRRTRFNISWIMLSTGFLLMAVRRLYELVDLLIAQNTVTASSWLAVAISISMFVGSVFIRKIFSLQDKMDHLRKESEAKVLTAILQTEEKERRSFARELHDGLGPLLSSVKMSLSVLRDKQSKNSESLISGSHKAVVEAIDTLREVSNRLSPHALEDFGLEKAINSYLQTINSFENLHISFNSNLQERRLNSRVELVLYRITGELVNNTLKYAEAEKAGISILNYQTHLEFIYSDNGKGYNPDARTDGLGLSSIRSRVISLDGRMLNASRPGDGCFIKVFIPLNYD